MKLQTIGYIQDTLENIFEQHSEAKEGAEVTATLLSYFVIGVKSDIRDLTKKKKKTRNYNWKQSLYLNYNSWQSILKVLKNKTRQNPK